MNHIDYVAGHPVLTGLYEGTCVRDTHGHGRNSIQALLAIFTPFTLDRKSVV